MGGKNWHPAVILAALMVVSGLFTACVPVTPAGQQPPPAAPVALFTFDPIVVSPLPVTAGQPFTVSMKIGNTGPAAGSYRADLLINGSPADNQTVVVGPGGSGQAVFQTTLQTPGTYNIKIGPQSTQVSVTQRHVPVTLKIDNGAVDGCDPVAGTVGDPANMIQTPNGHMLVLAAPPGGFVITGIDIFGYIKSSTYDYDRDPNLGGSVWVYGPDIASIEPINPTFAINIYDARRNKLYSGSFSRDTFDYMPRWVTVNIPDIKVSGDFSIELLTYNLPKLNAAGYGNWDPWHRYVVHIWYDQICIGYENSFDVRSYQSEGGTPVPDFYPTYNWLLRAEGYQP